MSGPNQARTGHLSSPESFQRRRRRRWLVVGAPFLVTLIVVSGVLVWGWETRQPAAGTPAGGGGPSGPDPNPQSDRVLSVTGSLVLSGNATGHLVLVETGNLCRACPLVVPADLRYSPPVAGFNVYLNLSNTGTEYLTVENFSLGTTTPSGGSPFSIYYVACCFPGYGEETTAMSLVGGQTLGVVVFIAAASLNGPTEVDYTLALSAAGSS